MGGLHLYQPNLFPDRLFPTRLSIITSLATQVPAYVHEQSRIAQFAAKLQASDDGEARKIRFLYRHSGIQTRYSVLPDYSQDPEEWSFYPQPNAADQHFPSLEDRMAVYDREAPKLAIAAAQACLQDQSPENITHLITVSCTGMRAPGLDLDLMDTLGLPTNVERLAIHFMGCYAAIQAMKAADAICARYAKARVLVVCTELCTLHFQQAPTEDNIMSTLLFADGSAAMLIENQGEGFHLDSFYSEVLRRGNDAMSWALGSTGFQMQLSSYVPELLSTDLAGLLNRAANHGGIRLDQITHWCVHPGGTRILEAVQKAANIPSESLATSYQVLSQYGNMSSPTVLFVLKAIEAQFNSNQPRDNHKILGLAFGPGLTMETFTAHYA